MTGQSGWGRSPRWRATQLERWRCLQSLASRFTFVVRRRNLCLARFWPLTLAKHKSMLMFQGVVVEDNGCGGHCSTVVGGRMHWTIWGQPEQSCERRGRRNFLRVGALGTGLTLAGSRRARAGVVGASPGAQSRSAILVFLAGGPSHYETFDPKPGAPLEIRGPFSPIATNVGGLRISENLPRLAGVADRYSLVRSCHHENPGHGGGQRQVQTGYKSASLEHELPHDYPVVGSVVAKARGTMSRGLPTFIRCPDSNDGGAAFLGNEFNPFPVYSTGKPVGLEVHGSMPLARLSDRRALREKFDRLVRQGQEQRVMDAMDAMEQDAYQMLTSTAAHEAFDVAREPQAVRDRYGSHDAGKCLLLARRFIEAGAGLVSVRIGSWDHHGNAGGTVVSGAKENCPPLDQALSALLIDLAERGMTDAVLVWCWGEFGRTPRINNTGGRDHWPQAMSVLMAGGGLARGRVVGATSPKGEYASDRILEPADVLATVYRQLGIDSTRQFINAAGRPISILPHGVPIHELL